MPRPTCYGVEANYPGGDLTAAEWEFLKAMERFQRRHRRRYPTWSEVLRVAHELGYRKVANPPPAEGDPPCSPDSTPS